MAFPKTFQPEKGEGANKYTLSALDSGQSVKLRVLSDFITGRSVWGDKDGKRVCTRIKDGETMPVGAIGFNSFTNKPERVKQFAAAVVWNYATEQLEIIETDKSTIIEQLFALDADEDWGDLKNYDIKISKTGEKMETKYTVNPVAAKPLEKSVTEAFKSANIRLEALYVGDDPFAPKEDLDFEASMDEIADEAFEALG